MTQQTAAADQAGISNRAAHRAAALAGIGYTVAWAVSQAVGAPNPSVAASGSQVVSAYAGRDWATIANLVLSEGIAAVALAAVVLLMAQAARRAGARRAGLAVAVFGMAAAVVSWGELVLGAWLQFGPVASGHPAAAGTVYSALMRIDGAKMFLLAAMAIALVVLSVTSAVLPRWLAPLGLLLAVLLVASGLGYLLLAQGLSDAVFASGVLLLVFVTATGTTMRTSRGRIEP
jgi:hypothetical protein